MSEVVTKALDAVYVSAAEDSHLDPRLARMQSRKSGSSTRARLSAAPVKRAGYDFFGAVPKT